MLFDFENQIVTETDLPELEFLIESLSRIGTFRHKKLYARLSM